MDLPRLGFGTYRLTDPDRCRTAVETALETGYRHVDTAEYYENEASVGAGIAESDVPREDVVVASKVWRDRLGYDAFLESARERVDLLGVETLDLLYVHWPMDTYDPEETLPALVAAREQGLTRHVGLSNFTPEGMDEAIDHLGEPPAAHQVELHPLLQQDDLRAHADRHGYQLVAYAPIARNAVADVPEIRQVAEKHDATPAQVSLAWVVEKGVVPIPKSGTPAHVRENYGALDLDLDDADVAKIDGIEREKRVVDFPNAPWK
ncbi:aldo/keto reductase [Haloplanus aerogenes]|uniref:Aldo/keto reductase n=1 Tax=Haloplanus aerogenes TaxID=660522 RepID=A0A3M0CK33_9EURY|nr:aldo/keto reductase [Haloplanus aerogenes]AZH26802.1 aldo/keto reductase [Haloplanus aerogenes]RMB09107.1 diketogulonate reductase-like aldo/keto reductase [Haloplanus aerogenes]